MKQVDSLSKLVFITVGVTLVILGISASVLLTVEQINRAEWQAEQELIKEKANDYE